MPNPARRAIQSDVNPANRAAASAGTMKSTRVVELAWRAGRDDAHRAGERRREHRVGHRELIRRQAGQHGEDLVLRGRPRARPKRVQRKSAASASAISTTTPAIQNRFAGIDAPNTRMMLVGKTFGICFDAEPNHSSTVAWRMSRMPSEATSLASGDDVRSGRKTSSSLSTPTRIAASNVRAIAGPVAKVKPNSSVRKAQNARGDHRHGARGEVDDPRAAVGDHHGHGDARDHRARPDAEQDEEQDVLHRVPSLEAAGAAIGGSGGCLCLAGPSFGRRHEVAGLLPLVGAVVLVELRSRCTQPAPLGTCRTGAPESRGSAGPRRTSSAPRSRRT